MPCLHSLIAPSPSARRVRVNIRLPYNINIDIQGYNCFPSIINYKHSAESHVSPLKIPLQCLRETWHGRINRLKIHSWSKWAGCPEDLSFGYGIDWSAQRILCFLETHAHARKGPSNFPRQPRANQMRGHESKQYGMTACAHVWLMFHKYFKKNLLMLIKVTWLPLMDARWLLELCFRWKASICCACRFGM